MLMYVFMIAQLKQWTTCFFLSKGPLVYKTNEQMKEPGPRRSTWSQSWVVVVVVFMETLVFKMRHKMHKNLLIYTFRL